LRLALLETVLVKAKVLVDRGDWLAALPLLSPWVEVGGLPRVHQAALLNLLGCCSCLGQDVENGVRFFSQAVKHSPNDPGLYQNLALAYEQQGQLFQAEPQWNRWFDLLGAGANGPQPPGYEDYNHGLVFEGLLRLANRFSERECWNQALIYMQRAQQLRPRDPETLERLFRLYVHQGQLEDARRILYQLREIQPDDGQYEHYELELVSVRTLNEVEQVLEDLDQTRRRHPESSRVQERRAHVVGTVLLPFLRKRFEGLSEELQDVVHEVNDLPDYQINWSAVANEVRDLRRHFLRLRRLGKLCLAQGASPENERRLHDLIGLINRKMGVCRSIME
jgi:tetratricopeptide (TPR) repeat protein